MFLLLIICNKKEYLEYWIVGKMEGKVRKVSIIPLFQLSIS